MTEAKSDERTTGQPVKPAEAAATVLQMNASIDTSRTGARLSAAVAEPPVPTQFGRYKIERELGKGAMGVVYLAEDTQLGRKVALKIPKKSILEESDALERFYREAKTTSQIRHNNICPVYDVGAIDGVHYLTMAYIPGKPISSFVGKGKLPPAKQVALLIRKIALALEEAHKQGVVHRDLKPSNVMLDDRNEPIVMDFGLACQMNTSENARLTQSGAILGTPAYMAPEQVRGELSQIGPQIDIYALGVMMYQFLTGELPFSGPVMMVFAQIISNEAKRPSEIRPDIDPTLEAICLKMMAKELADRFLSMKEVASALTEYMRTGAVAGPPSTTTVAPSMPGVDPEPDIEELPAFPDAAIEVRKPRSKKNRKSLTAKRTGWLWPATGAAAGVLLMVLFAVVIVLRNGKVEVQVKVDDPTAIVKVDGQQVEIDSKGIGMVRLTVDKHSYVIERNGETIRGPEEFTITKAGKKELVITVTKVDNPDPKTETGTSPPPPTDPKEPLSGVVIDAALHRQAAEWALKHGADVQIERVEPEVPPWRTITDINDLPAEDFQLVGVNFGPYSHEQKTSKSISAEGWRWLQQTRVKNLTLPPQPLTENDLSELLKCSDLNTLSLISTGATNAVVPPLSKLDKLESLFLDETKVTRQGLSQLREFPALKSLSLFSLKLRDADLEPLNSLRLETLYLTGNPITDDGLRYLQEMPLQMLYLSGTQISDQGLEQLPVENMRWLILEATPITDRALDVLDRFPKLLSVGLQNTKLTPARIREFAARHPQCGVFYTENGQIQVIEPKPPVETDASSPP